LNQKRRAEARPELLEMNAVNRIRHRTVDARVTGDTRV
jgi:hypothetical protein